MKEKKLRKAKYTTSTFFDAVIKEIKAANAIPEGLELDYINSCSWHEKELRTYEFSNASYVDFGGNEGIYCNFVLSLFENGERKNVQIGTAKTLNCDLEAMRKMGELSGIFTYFCNKFVEENIDDFSYEGFKVSANGTNASYETCTMERAMIRASELAEKYGSSTITNLATGEVIERGCEKAS